jgi:hypothetical protein
MVSYINPNDKAREVVSQHCYPTVPKRFVYSLQRSMNRGLLLGYAGAGTDKVSAAVKKNELFLGSTDRVGDSSIRDSPGYVSATMSLAS